MSGSDTVEDRFQVLIAGGGVAALEAALRLHTLAGTTVSTTVLAPNDVWVNRLLAVREPFAGSGARRYPLAPILEAAGAGHEPGKLLWLDHANRVGHTDSGRTLSYDAVLLALGARPQSTFKNALTLDPDRLDEQLHGLVQDAEDGYVSSIAFVIPIGRVWPLPIYELALMTARRAWNMGVRLRVRIVTPEPTPLACFGTAASAMVAAILESSGVEIICDAVAEIHDHGTVTVLGRVGELLVDRVVALPALYGQAVPGLPASASRGFVATDAHGRVRQVSRVFAAGDCTDYPIKQGAIAAQQAAAVAEEIAGLSGVATTAAPFEPVLHGILMSGERPLFMRARLVGGAPTGSQASYEPLWDPADKIHTPALTTVVADLELKSDSEPVSIMELPRPTEAA